MTSLYSIAPCDHHNDEKTDLPDCADIPNSRTPRCENKCTSQTYDVKTYSNDKHRVSRAYGIRTEANIQRAIMEDGPVEAAFTVYDDFMSYKSGVYQHTTGRRLGGHAIKIVGWGVEDGVKYWTIANSWNPNWGEDGFFRILRGSDHCGIESDVNAGDAVWE